jgi:small GTP-binding protein
MSQLKVGIVGLPNSGKSTLFNALLKRQVANVAAYPFTTIEPNVGIVEVPDERLKKLAEMIKPEKVTPAVVQFIDIAGLVKNAHQGEGLGNQFLAKIREVDAVVQVVRGFKDETVTHYYGSVDPQRDKEIIDIELALGEIKKPTLYLLNQDEISPREGFLVVNAKTGEGVENLIRAAYQLLGLITFYTIKGGKEVAAWSLKKEASAFEAAAMVHTEMAKGFIKAEVVGYEELVVAGSWQAAKTKGKVRLEGRDYLVQDGEVIEFKFGH